MNDEDFRKEVQFDHQQLTDEKANLGAIKSLIDKVGELCVDTGGASPIGVSIVFAEPGPNGTTLFHAKTVTRKKDAEKRLQEHLDKAVMEWVKEEFGEGVPVVSESMKKDLMN